MNMADRCAARPAVPSALNLGWSQTDITPDRTVLIAGQFHARLSEGILDPVTATAWAIQSGLDHAVMVSCDLVAVADQLRDEVRARLAGRANGLDPLKVILHATHTHAAPETRVSFAGAAHVSRGVGVELDAMPVVDYVRFAADRIAEAVLRAWAGRRPGSVAFGLGCAVVGRNRRWVDDAGVSTMYGNTDTPAFGHAEGYEDHSLGLLASYGEDGVLNGLAVNVPCPSQVSENEFRFSADYWHDTRLEMRRRFGAGLFVLPQCGAAGDQSPHLLFDKRGWTRMLELKGRAPRQEIACRIADGVEDTLPWMSKAADRSPRLRHHVETLELPMNALTEDDAAAARKESEAWGVKYEEEKRKLAEQPELRNAPRWYVPVTRAYRRMQWYLGVVERFESWQTRPTRAVEVHVIRLGDAVIATNPFEYYLDYGIRIKARSKATQTFLVQLAGEGTYVPSRRSVAGGGYGSVPASNAIGPEGGRRLADRTIEIIEHLWAEA
jgi:hypothetical protein